jgi:hypothetical protein
VWIVALIMVGFVITGYLVGPPWRGSRRSAERPVERSAERPVERSAERPVERWAEVPAHPAVEAVLGRRRESTEVGLTASRIAGALSHTAYQEAMAALAAEDMAREPVVVPGD